MTGEDYWREALSWERTPFHWQASLKGVGADCKGLVWGAARELALPEANSPWAAIIDYGRNAPVPVGKLREGLADTLLRVFEPAVGDVLVLRVCGRPQHLAIFGGDRIIHTWPQARMVKATATAPALRCWPLDSIWRFRSLTGEAL